MPSPDQTTPTGAKTQGDIKAEGNAIKFLLVDDLPENLLALEALLRREGLELHKAGSGAEALELLLTQDFALALLDVQMPGMDGFELAELMRSTERTRHIPIIFLTAVATDERRRFRGYETGAVDYLFKPLDAQVLKNKAEIYFELARQRQELARQRDELQRSAGQLARALGRLRAHGDNSPLAIVEFGPDLEILSWSKGAERAFGWKAGEMQGHRADERRWLQDEDAKVLRDLSTDMLAGRAARHVHAGRAQRKDGSVLDCEWYSSALLDAEGRLVSINAQILDVSERRRAEETQRLLLGELNHRVKNMLAMVQAIATQTLRHTANPAEFSDNFSGRIQSLARAHSLLSSGSWQGTQLADLVAGQAQSGALDEERLTVAGPEVHLTPSFALHLALILHELTTNAHKYGALSRPAGRVSITWTVEDERLRLKWAELGGPAVKAPTKRGFGTRLIEQSVRAERGEAHASYGAEGLTWEISLALPRATQGGGGAAANPGHGAMAPRPEVAEPEQVLAGRRFLVVEDEPLVALETATLLEDAGATVVGMAGTAQQALALIDSVPIDATLLDANLLGCAVGEIAAALTRRKIPFAFVSGYTRENLPEGFRHVALVSKPFRHDQLLQAAAALLQAPAEVLRMKR